MTKKMTSGIALGLVQRIEDLKRQISEVYREVGDNYGAGEINLVRDLVDVRENAADAALEAQGLLEAIDLLDDD